MLNLTELYANRAALKAYNEQVFVQPKFKFGLLKPYLFLVNKKDALSVSNYTLSSTEDRGYDIHIISSESMVLFYLIDAKMSHVRATFNGLVLHERLKMLPSDTQDVKVRYNMNDFLVLTNKFETCTVFGKNATNVQRT